MKLRVLAAVSALGLLASPGCAAASDDSLQDIAVVTDPPGASCVLERVDQTFGLVDKQISTIASTPGTANVSKSGDDITIKCDKPGFQQARYVVHLKGTSSSSITAGDVGKAILEEPLSELTFGLSGPSTDWSKFKYDSPVNIALTPLGAPPAAPAAAAPAPLPPTPSPNATQLASLPPQPQPPSGSLFDGQWQISGKGAFGISIGNFQWKFTVAGNSVSVTGEFGDMTFKEGHVDGDRITLLWTGIFDATFEGKLVSPTRIEGHCSTALSSADWLAEKQ